MSPGQPVPPACEAARELLLDRLELGGADARPSEGFHCDACRLWFEHARMQARALAALPRQCPEPTMLDGLVIAGLHAGLRQERATAAVAALEKLTAPDQLGDLLGERFGRSPSSAPRELDQRVEDELRAGAALRAGRQLGSLARLAAPAELDLLVATRLARPARTLALPPRRWIAAAAALAILIGAGSLAHLSGVFQSDPAYPFRVVHTASLSDLDPVARAQLIGISGWVEVPTATTSIQRPGGAR